MNDSNLHSALSHWLLVGSPMTLVAARENHVYRVDSSDGSVALRLHRPGYRDTEEIKSELQWMNMLAEQGMPVPKPIAAKDGSYVHEINGQTVSVLSWLNGTPWSQLPAEPEQYYQLGIELSKMHRLADAWTLPENFKRPTWNLLGEQPSWDRFWENPLLNDAQAQRFTEFRMYAQQELSALGPLDEGLIHADLIPDNVLHFQGTLQIIDFDDGGFGYRLFDLATITRHCRQLKADDSLADAAINGYKVNRTIDVKALLLFEALRACTYIGWNISRLDEPKGLERNARYISEAEKALDNFEQFS